MDLLLGLTNDSNTSVLDLVLADEDDGYGYIVPRLGGMEQVLAFTYDPANDNGSGQTEYTWTVPEGVHFADVLVVAGGGRITLRWGSSPGRTGGSRAER